ncbi:acyl-CoA synthetase [Mycobacteroides abscessus subsp. abscessus]|nr:acyl-CoA synthetase [Mycobacteroides abscessus subsp. abscessus]
MSHSPPPTVLERIVAQARTRPDSIALRRCDGRDAMSYGDT